MQKIEQLVSKYLPVISQFPDLCLLKAIDSTYIAANINTAKLFGYKDYHACSGMSDYDIRGEAVTLADQFIAEDKYVLTHGESKQVYITSYNDGDIKILYGTKTIFKDDTGTVIGILSCNRDVTHSIEMEKSFIPNILLENKKSFSSNKSIKFDIKTHFPRLTKRESQVYFLLIRNLSNKEIATIFNISTRTVEKYTANIMEKLLCKSRHQLIQFAHDQNFTQVLLNTIVNDSKILNC